MTTAYNALKIVIKYINAEYFRDINTKINYIVEKTNKPLQIYIEMDMRICENCKKFNLFWVCIFCRRFILKNALLKPTFCGYYNIKFGDFTYNICLLKLLLGAFTKKVGLLTEYTVIHDMCFKN